MDRGRGGGAGVGVGVGIGVGRHHASDFRTDEDAEVRQSAGDRIYRGCSESQLESKR